MDRRNRQPTSVRLNYRATDRQTQTSAVWFGREEWAEHTISLLGIDPCAGILDTDKHAIVEMLGTHMEQVWAICDRGHGVECICKEIQKNLLKLHSIG